MSVIYVNERYLCCESSCVRPSSGIKPSTLTADVTEFTTSQSAVQRPSSVIPLAVVTTGTSTVPVTSHVATTTSASVTAGVDRVPTTDESLSLQRPSTSVAATDVVAGAQDVTVTSSVTSAGSTSSLLAQLAYTEPSLELLRRRRVADTARNSDTSTVNTATRGATTHLLSSATQAALAALASTPRRYVTIVSVSFTVSMPWELCAFPDGVKGPKPGFRSITFCLLG